MNGNTTGEVVDEASKWLVGGGILTLSLAPLALPAIVLLLVAALPLVALGLVGGLLAAIVIGPILLVRRIWRRLSAKQLDRHVGAPALVPPHEELAARSPVVAGAARDRLPMGLAGRPKG
jgi:hypothetical protein